MVHAPHTKFHVVKTVLETGFDGNLAKGQFAVVKNKAAKGKGKEVINDFDGFTSNDNIALQIGIASTPGNLRIKDVPYKSTGWFKLGDITGIKAYAPSNVQLTVDHLEVGFDGINNNTALFIPEGKAAVMDIVVSGEVASMFFGRPRHIIQKRVLREVGQTMQEVIRRVVKEINDQMIPTAIGWASTSDKLSQFLEVGTIDSSASPVTGVNSTFLTLTLTDKGDSNDLADIQAQYPAYKVTRTSRDGDTSVYTVIKPTLATALASYVKTTVDVDGKDCKECLAGYTEVAGGFVYHVAISDSGVDSTVALAALFTGETGLVKFGNDGSKGIYSIILPTILTQAQNDAFLVARPEAELTLIGDLKKVCSKTSSVTTAWVDGKTCVATTKDFSIVLKDTKCGESRLVELQKNFSDLNIIEGAYTGGATQTATLSGTTGNAVLAIAGTNYSTLFTTDLATTASLFVSTHAANILAATTAVVTASGAVLTFADATNFPSISAVTGGLVETVNSAVFTIVPKAGGCKRTYSTKVITNIVCEQCDKIFLQPFYANAPEDFQGVLWEEANKVFDTNAKMGIFVKGKSFYMTPEAYEEDFVPFMETSLKVDSISFGYREDDSLTYTGSFYDVATEFFEGRKLTYAKDVKNLSQNYFGAEDEGNLFGTNKAKHKANLFARANLSQERLLGYNKRILTYIVYTHDTSLSQGGSGRSDISHGFGLLVEEGKHNGLELILNKLAAKVGLPAVNASAT